MTSAVTGRHSNQLNYRAVLLLCRCVSATCTIIRTMPHIVNTFLKKSFGRGKSPPIPFVLPKSHSAESSFSSLRSLCTSLNCIDLCRPYFTVQIHPACLYYTRKSEARILFSTFLVRLSGCRRLLLHRLQNLLADVEADLYGERDHDGVADFRPAGFARGLFLDFRGELRRVLISIIHPL